jgi:diadenosine tetraphosphate (Ap4A) HIT family hydrolase
MSTSYAFGPWTIRASEVFASSPLSFASVNLKPVVPGHVLIISKRVCPRFCDLNEEEVADLWLLARRVGAKVEPHFKATSLTMAIQDGSEAGQTVPHVHIHILPRCRGDFEKNDEVYDAIDESSKDMGQGGEPSKLSKDLDKERKPRTQEEMAKEADELRSLFED